MENDSKQDSYGKSLERASILVSKIENDARILVQHVRQAEQAGQIKIDKNDLDWQEKAENAAWRKMLEEAVNAVLPAIWAMRLPSGTIERTDKRKEGWALGDTVQVSVYPLIPMGDQVTADGFVLMDGLNYGEVKFLCVSKGGQMGERCFRVSWPSGGAKIDLASQDGVRKLVVLEKQPAVVGTWWSGEDTMTYGAADYEKMLVRLDWVIGGQMAKAQATHEANDAFQRLQDEQDSAHLYK